MTGSDGPLKPMLACEARGPFSAPGWLFEVKWDGLRAIANGGRLYTRGGLDVTARFPEVAERLPARTALDGELVVAVDGRPDFDAALDRLRLTHPRRIDAARGQRPATFVVFDRPDLADQPQRQRCAALAAMALAPPCVRINPLVEADGLGLWRQVCRQAWEGMLAKRADARYRPGERSRAWLKVKNRRSFPAVVTGVRGDGRLIVADPQRPESPLAVAAGVTPALLRAIGDGRIRLPLACRISHVGRTFKGRWREPALESVEPAPA